MDFTIAMSRLHTCDASNQPDPFMLKTWVIIVMAVLVVCGCRNVKKVSKSTVEDDIRAHLPIGSSKADVIAFLDQRKISHSWLEKPEVLPGGKVVIPNSHRETGRIPNVRNDGLVIKTMI